VVNEANPSARVFEEHVYFLLERFALPLVEHVLGLERLIDGQVDRIVRVRDAGRRGRLGVAGRDHLHDGRVVRVAAGRRQVREAFARLAALLQRRRHAPVVRLAEPRHPPVVVRRPHVLVRRFRSARAAVEPFAPPPQLIVVTVLRRGAADGPAAAADTDADTATVATAVAAVPQRHFSGLAKQLHLFGAVHVDAKRPRQHPAAAVRMVPVALCARFAGQRARGLCRVPVVPTVGPSASSVVTVPVLVATAKPSDEYARWRIAGRWSGRV